MRNNESLLANEDASFLGGRELHLLAQALLVSEAGDDERVVVVEALRGRLGGVEAPEVRAVLHDEVREARGPQLRDEVGREDFGDQRLEAGACADGHEGDSFFAPGGGHGGEVWWDGWLDTM